jgi:multidrug resistance efflux pump
MKRFAVSMVNTLIVIVALFALSSLASSASVDGFWSNSDVRFVRAQDDDEGQEVESDESEEGDDEVEQEATESEEDDSSEKEAVKEEPTPAKAGKEDAATEKKAAKSEPSAKQPEKSAGKQPTKQAGKGVPGRGGKQAEKQAAAEKKSRKTHKVDTKRLKVEVPLDGTFVARKMEEVVLRPEVWTSFEIKEIVEHGSKVHRGQVLVKFDDERIKEAIDDLELDQRLNELAIRRAEEDLPRQERSIALALENAERTDKETKQDYARYNEIDRPMVLKSVENSLRRSQFNLDYEKDELEQLEKMYAADDLTEETEEVVLKRQRNLVSFAEFSLENAKLNRDEILSILLPRLDIQMKQSLETAEIALARAKMASAIDVNRGRYELEQRKQARSQSLERHAKLIKDRGLMEIKSPADGIVYYGQCVDGRWADMASLINRLRPHNNVTAGSVMMTVLESRPLIVLANVDEAKRPEIAVDQKVKISPPAEGSAKLDGKISKVSPVPTGAGRFAVELELTSEVVPEWIVAGMTCKLRITAYDKADAVAVPKAAVRSDEDDEDKKFVWIVDADDAEVKPVRRDVTVGKTSGNDTEILKGLKKGETISLEDESAAAKSDAKADEKKSS